MVMGCSSADEVHRRTADQLEGNFLGVRCRTAICNLNPCSTTIAGNTSAVVNFHRGLRLYKESDRRRVDWRCGSARIGDGNIRLNTFPDLGKQLINILEFPKQSPVLNLFPESTKPIKSLSIHIDRKGRVPNKYRVGSPACLVQRPSLSPQPSPKRLTE